MNPRFSQKGSIPYWLKAEKLPNSIEGVSGMVVKGGGREAKKGDAECASANTAASSPAGAVSDALPSSPVGATAWRDLSPRRIIGFACNQAFLLCSLFTGDVLFVLLFMVAGFALVRIMGASRLSRLFARPLLYLYAVVAACGSLLPLLFPEIAGMIALHGLLVGVPCALLFTAWGRAFDRESTQLSIPEVFLGSLVGAFVCLVFSLAGAVPVAWAAVSLLPFASAVNIEVRTPLATEDPRLPAPQEGPAAVLSAKILAGTVLFGMAAGIMLLESGATGGVMVAAGTAGAAGGAAGSALGSAAGGEWLAYSRMGLVLYAAFLAGSLTLLLSDGFGRGASLNKSYRLAVFVMMVGVLLVPWPLMQASILPGEAVVFAGGMGLQAVLVSLFLVLAELTGADCALSFSAGFTALFAGEFVGAVAGWAMGTYLGDSAQYAAVVVAGAIMLIGYVFLFTERDFDALSQLVTESDAIEVASGIIVERYGLSNRESEILAFALRGRTSERIAQELVISKSTVDTHLRRIYAKCGVHSRQELLDLAERVASA